MDYNTMLAILGALTTIGLTVNGFFLKGILISQNDMKVEIGKLLVKVENYSGRIDELEHKTRRMEIEFVRCKGHCESTNTAMQN